MDIDIRHLALLAMFNSILLLIAMLLASRLNRSEPGVRSWMKGALLLAAGYLLFFLRGIVPDLLSIILANALLLVGYIWFYYGLREALGQPQGRRWDIPLALSLVLAFAYFTYVDVNLQIRIVIISVVLAAVFLMSAHFLLLSRPARPDKNRTTLALLGLAYLSFAVFMLVRSLLTAEYSPGINFVQLGDPIQSLTFLFVAILGITQTISLSYLVASRNVRRLAQSEGRFRKLVEEINAIGWELELKERRFTYVSPHVEKMVGHPPGYWVGFDSWAATIYPEDREKAIQYCLTQTEQGLDHTFDYRLLKADGDTVWVRDIAKVHKDESGQPVALSGFIIDISVLKAAETEAQQQRVAAEQANKAKSKFLATMSHEIRTPMNGILGMAQLMLMEDEMPDERRKDYARTIYNSGQTLLVLLNDILDLSKVEAGKMELSNSTFSPQQLIEETAQLFTQAAQSKGLTIEANWQGPQGSYYEADTARLRQMLSNLIGNAIKFTSQGYVRIDALVVEEENRQAMLEFSVTDSGIGILPEEQALLFQPFSQAYSFTGQEYGGTGLGLSIVRGLANLMNGDVGIESEPGRGSRFWFRVRVGVLADKGDHRQTDRDVVATDLSKTEILAGTVLLVEDNATNRLVVETLLRKLGVTVTTVENGQEAVEALRDGQRPGLVLMDIQMPVMDGITATEHIRSWEKATGQARLPIIAFTAGAFEEDRQRCLAAGMDDFLTKPVNFAELRRVVSQRLEAR